MNDKKAERIYPESRERDSKRFNVSDYFCLKRNLTKNLIQHRQNFTMKR